MTVVWQSDLVESFAFPIVYRYVSSGLAGGAFNEAEFAKLYDEIEAYLSSNVSTVRAFLDLGHLTGDALPLTLDPRRRIIALERDTVKRMLVRAYGADVPLSLGSSFLVGQIGGVRYTQAGQLAMEITFQYPKEKLSELSLILKKEADEAATALRLSQSGTGSIRFLDYEHVGFVPEFGRFGFADERSTLRFAYKLDEGVAKAIAKHWPDSSWVSQQMFSSSSALSTPLRIAIERFNLSFEKKVPADRLLDYIIALEALCSRENDAVAYRVALRVATLIGRDASDRGSVYRVVSEAYDERSTLAHGKASKLTGSEAGSASEYLLGVEAVLLRTMHAFVRAEKRNQKKNEVLKIIDTAIATQDRSHLESTVVADY